MKIPQKCSIVPKRCWQPLIVRSYRWGDGELCTAKNIFSPAFKKKKIPKSRKLICWTHKVSQTVKDLFFQPPIKSTQLTRFHEKLLFGQANDERKRLQPFESPMASNKENGFLGPNSYQTPEFPQFFFPTLLQIWQLFSPYSFSRNEVA